MDRLSERLRVGRQALETFQAALREPKTAMNRDACIQRFEYTHEAVWKAAQLISGSTKTSNWLRPRPWAGPVFDRRF